MTQFQEMNDPIITEYQGSLFGNMHDEFAKFFQNEACDILVPFLQMVLMYGLPLGKYPLLRKKIKEEHDSLHDDIYASCEACHGKGKEHAVLESHMQYIDIQIALQGTDYIGLYPLDKNPIPSGPYNKDKDIIFYATKPSSYYSLSPGNFVIFPPHICHAPLCGTEDVTKLVIKVQSVYAKPHI